MVYEINRAKDPISITGSIATSINKIRVNICSCYALSGVSISQYSGGDASVRISCNYRSHVTMLQIVGDSENLVKRTSAVFNIGPQQVLSAMEYFGQFSCSHDELIRQYATQKVNTELD